MKEPAEAQGLTVAAVPGGTEPGISVIVPVTERPEPLAELYEEYAQALRKAGYTFEFIFVTEPAHQGMVRPLPALAERGEPIRVFSVGQAVGEGALLKLAAERCRAPVVVTLPAYRRVEASTLPALIGRVRQGADMAVARRWPRRDSWVNRLQSRVLHRLIGQLSGRRIHDVACGVRAMRRELLLEIPLYGDFSRFLPLLALQEGYRVEEVPCAQHGGDTGARFYSPGLYLRRLIDVLGLFFLLRFTEKPLRFFGLVGSSLSLLGGLVLVVLLVQRLQGQGLANRPLLILGALLLVVGVQAIALGLVGEIIVHLHATTRRPYRLDGAPGPTGPAESEGLERGIGPADARGGPTAPAGAHQLSGSEK